LGLQPFPPCRNSRPKLGPCILFPGLFVTKGTGKRTTYRPRDGTRPPGNTKTDAQHPPAMARRTSPTVARSGSRVVAYLRVSTEEQAKEGLSLEAQRRKVEAWAELHGAELVAVLVDEGRSAKNLNRPALQEALGLLRSGSADSLLVCKLDRLTRSVRDLLGLVDELFSRDGAGLVSINEDINTTSAAGRMVLTMMGAMAEWERAVIGERTAEALAVLKADGIHAGRSGLGWRRLESTDEHGRRVLAVEPTERAAIERARQLRAEGLALRAIAERLTAEGHKTKRGGTWYAASVARALGAELPAGLAASA
jgi:site-specific DNA recombinase